MWSRPFRAYRNKQLRGWALAITVALHAVLLWLINGVSPQEARKNQPTIVTLTLIEEKKPPVNKPLRPPALPKIAKPKPPPEEKIQLSPIVSLPATPSPEMAVAEVLSEANAPHQDSAMMNPDAEIHAQCALMPPPQYPPSARSANVQAEVIVRFRINSDGKMSEIVGINYGTIPRKLYPDFLSVVEQALAGYQCDRQLAEQVLEKSIQFKLLP